MKKLFIILLLIPLFSQAQLMTTMALNPKVEKTSFIVQPSTLYENIVAVWPFDDLSGNLTEVVNGYDGDQFTGVPTRGVTGMVDEAYQFNGDSYIDVDYNNNLFADRWTASICVKIDTAETRRGVWQGCGGNGFNHGWVMRVNPLNLSIRWGNGVTVDDSLHTTLPSLDTWHHVVYTCDSLNMKLYLDGVLVDSVLNINFSYDTIQPHLYEMKFAVYDGGASFKGALDQAMFYDKAFSDQEVSGLWNDGNILPFDQVIEVPEQPEPPTGTATLWFTDLFDSGSLGYPCDGNCPTITTEQVRSGAYAMKTYLSTSSPVDYRTEISYSAHKDTIGHHYWYGFSVFLPNDYLKDGTWEIVAQWHGVPDGYPTFDPGEEYWRNPLGFLETTDSIWTYGHKYSAQANQGPLGSVTYDGSNKWNFGYVETGVWVDWVIHYKYSYLSDGITQIWKDGKLVLDYRGPNCYNDEVGPYFKMGLYKGWNNWENDEWRVDNVDNRTLYHDQLRVAFGENGYSVVDPSQ